MSPSAIRTGGLRLPFQYHRQNVELFDDFVIERGITVLWQKSLLCPCQTSYGTPDPYCPLCYGRGFFHQGEEEIRVLITDIQGVPQFLRPGFWLWGTAYLTTTSGVKMAFRDRVILPGYTATYLEVRKVQGNRITFPLRKPVAIETVGYLGEDGRFVALEASQYTYEDGILTFTASVGDGTLVTIRYSAPLIYMVVNLLHEARGWRDELGREVAFPNQYLVQREDLVVEEKKVSTEE